MDHLTPHTYKTAPRVVIVGGLGEMGKLFHRIFAEYTTDIVIVDRETELQAHEAVQQANIVLLSVSIGETLPLIKELAPQIPPTTLFMDVTSLKQAEMDAMIKFSDPSIEILGTHPLFGPYNDIQGQVIALTPVRGTSWLPYIKKVFKQAGLVTVNIAPEEHDKLMSLVQVLLHVILFSLIGTAQKLNLDPKLLKTISTPLFKIVWTLGERILTHDSKLYRHIALGNAHSLATLTEFKAVFEQLVSNIATGDGGAFEKQFCNLRTFLEQTSYDKQEQDSTEQSQRLIDFFSKDFLAEHTFQKMLKAISEESRG